MTKPVKNHAKSVKTRLLNLMNTSGYKYMYLLARYFNAGRPSSKKFNGRKA